MPLIEVEMHALPPVGCEKAYGVTCLYAGDFPTIPGASPIRNIHVLLSNVVIHIPA